MIPIKIDTVRDRSPVVTILLIIICIGAFFRQFYVPERTGLVPLEFVYTILHPKHGVVQSVAVILFALFIHGSFLHLLGNMWYLWLFGSALENEVGPLRFVVLYLVFGIISMLVQVAADPLSTIPIVGASGAIAGIMGVYLIVKPFSKIIFGLPPLLTVRIYAFLFLIFWFWMQWVGINNQQKEGALIAWGAHIGGFISGMFYAIWLRMSNSLSSVPAYRKKRRR